MTTELIGSGFTGAGGGIHTLALPDDDSRQVPGRAPREIVARSMADAGHSHSEVANVTEPPECGAEITRSKATAFAVVSGRAS